MRYISSLLYREVSFILEVALYYIHVVEYPGMYIQGAPKTTA
jgi:hypothetical protein